MAQISYAKNYSAKIKPVQTLRKHSKLVNKMDISSILNKSKSSITKLSSTKIAGPKQFNLAGVQSIRTSTSSQTHTFTIIDQYLIKVAPKSYSKPEDANPLPVTSFDLDGTLIQTKSSGKFARSPEDWVWFNDKVIPTLKQISTPIVIFTNQGGVVAQKTAKSYTNLIKKLELILKNLEKNGVDVTKIWVLASPKKSASYKGTNAEMFETMRKPNDGMFIELEKDLGLVVDKANTLYVGDAAGRPDDFSDSDLRFAERVGIDFKVPEDYFI